MFPIERQEFTVRKWPLYFVAALFVVFIYVIGKTGRQNDITSLLAAGGVMLFLFVYYMLSKSKLIIDNDGITQQLFLGKQKEILWKELTASSFQWHYHGHGASLQWEFTSITGKKIGFQSSGYSRTILREIAIALMGKRPDIVTDKRILRIAAGDFPWYIF